MRPHRRQRRGRAAPGAAIAAGRHHSGRDDARHGRLERAFGAQGRPRLARHPGHHADHGGRPRAGFHAGRGRIATKPVDRARLAQILKKYTCPHPPCPVLLVEDDPATREMTRTILEKEGWKVMRGRKRARGPGVHGAGTSQLILLDLMMPEMDGFEFAAQVRQKPEWRSIPIVVLTAHDLSAEERRRSTATSRPLSRKAATRTRPAAPSTRPAGRTRVAPRSTIIRTARKEQATST